MSLRQYALGCMGAFVVLSLWGIAFAATKYSDPVGDVQVIEVGTGPICGTPLERDQFQAGEGSGTGPDIASVAVSSTKVAVTFSVRFATAPPLRANLNKGWTDMLLTCLDVPPLGTPPKPNGSWLGGELGAGTMGAAKTGALLKVAKDGTTAPVARFKVITRGSVLTFSIPRRALGSPAWFAFQVAATRNTDPFETTTAATVDIAPARGTFRYTLIK